MGGGTGGWWRNQVKCHHKTCVVKTVSCRILRIVSISNFAYPSNTFIIGNRGFWRLHLAGAPPPPAPPLTTPSHCSQSLEYDVDDDAIRQNLITWWWWLLVVMMMMNWPWVVEFWHIRPPSKCPSPIYWIHIDIHFAVGPLSTKSNINNQWVWVLFGNTICRKPNEQSF